MDEFNSLIDVLNRLLGPNGCPWDREQTLQSMRHLLIEETFEVVEAIDLNDNYLIEEEIGDLFFNAIFLCALAEKEHRFNLRDVLKRLLSKIIYRHPHIFGENRLDNSEEVLKQWEKIKLTEKGQRQSTLDGIPKDLPALAKAQKIAKKISNNKQFTLQTDLDSLSSEEKAGENLWQAVQMIAQQGIQAEQALRKRLVQIEVQFRKWEQQQKKPILLEEDQN